MDRQQPQRIEVPIASGEHEIEFRWIAPERHHAPVIVFLHEGLGSLAIWEDWPQRLCDAAECRGLIYSRYGYGHSTPRPPQQDWPHDYLEREARESLPAFLKAKGLDPAREKIILFGHSDGGTIALLYAAAFPQAVSAVISLAAHVFTEKVGHARIGYLQSVWQSGGLRERMARLHAAPDEVFAGWSKLWLSPDFQSWDITSLLPGITCPLLVVQGRQDQYGTLAQIDAIQRQVPHAQTHVLENCRHVPHQEQPQALLDACLRFLHSI
ncbi:pimeloyl-ACP methyl ester carboxylesterase [Paucimonas lemoignei]|uniref:Pimeloyl-ACP methyl ester carboxylesterase n=1 Tax=Paucimonas lemoignei TaxID=29443 RepID=A0A4R3HQA9_PAULE|nr:alpha/beta hydrolase [Paucimonas lemoignei]TCS34377.1 pimeloyl-ACP methyl ester carboxylesterase [Paucimonas lemoignei]